MAEVNTSVYISAPPSEFKEEDIYKALQDGGGIGRCAIVRTIVGMTTGTAYVQFDEVKKAIHAIQKRPEEKVIKETMVQENRKAEFNLVMTQYHQTKIEESSTICSTVVVQETPKMTVISGNSGKNCSFGRWRYEVDCLVQYGTYTPHMILHAAHVLTKSSSGTHHTYE